MKLLDKKEISTCQARTINRITQKVVPEVSPADRKRIAKICLFAALLFGAQTRTLAALYQVDSNLDDVDSSVGDGICKTALAVCTLRAAIQQSNNTPGLDRIEMPAGLFSIAIAGRDEDNSARGDFDIQDHSELVGAGEGQTIVDGAFLDRVFDIHGQILVTLQNMTIQNGLLTDSTGGAGIRMQTGAASKFFFPPLVASVKKIELKNNDAGAGYGGGIHSAVGGVLTIEKSVFSLNQAKTGGAIYVENPLQILHSTITNNRSDQKGGGVYAKNGLYLYETTVTQNTTSGSGGGVHAETHHVVIHGGSINNNKSNTLLAVDGSEIPGVGGGLRITNAAGTVGASNMFFYLGGSTIADNQSTGSAGGIGLAWTAPASSSFAKIVNLKANGNFANTSSGGGAHLTALNLLENSIFDSNSANTGGGGIILQKSITDTTTTYIRNSALTNNSVTYTGSIGASGGGLSANNGNYTIINSTISNNTVSATGSNVTVRGGGINISGGGTGKLEIAASTIVNNTASTDNGTLPGLGYDISANSLARLGLGTSIVHSANYFGNNCQWTGFGQVVNIGYNLYSNSGCAPSSNVNDIVTATALLSPLDTQSFTHAFLSNSPAVAVVPMASCQTTDQRGLKRKTGACDIGAYESDALPMSTGSIEFAQVSATVAEQAGFIDLILKRIGGVDGELSVDVVTWPVTAQEFDTDTVNIKDYDNTVQSANWINGDSTNKTIRVNIVNGVSTEGAETFIARILPLTGNDSGTGLAQPKEVVVTITESSNLTPVINFKLSQYSVNEAGNGVTVVLTRNLANEVATVNYVVAGGSATRGVDFVLSDGALRFERGELEKALVIPIIDDGVDEGDEIIVVNLSSAQGATLGSRQSTTITIIGNGNSGQPGSTMLFTEIEKNHNEAEGVVKIDMQRSGDITNASSIDIELLPSGSSNLGQDFTLGANFIGNVAHVVFPANVTTASVELTLIDDSLVEASESIVFRLSNPSTNSGIGSNSSTTIQITDNDSPNQTPSDPPGSVSGGGAEWFLGVLMLLGLRRSNFIVATPNQTGILRPPWFGGRGFSPSPHQIIRNFIFGVGIAFIFRGRGGAVELDDITVIPLFDYVGHGGGDNRSSSAF